MQRTNSMSRRIGQLFLDRPALTRRATLSSINTSEDGHVLDAVDTGPAPSPDKYSAEELSSSSDEDEEEDHLQAVRKMEKLKRTLGQNVPPDLVFGTHLALSMYPDPSLALSRTSTTTTTTQFTPSTVTTTTTTLSNPRPQTPWIAPWEEIDPESYARTHHGLDTPTNSTGRSFWRKAGEAAAATNGGRRGSEGGVSNNSGSSGGGRRTSNDSSSVTGSTHALSLSVVRIDHPPPSSSDMNAFAVRSAKAPASSPSTPGSGSASVASSAAGVGVVAVAAKGGMSNLSKIARGAASDANRRGAHKNTPPPEKTRLNRRRATRMTNVSILAWLHFLIVVMSVFLDFRIAGQYGYRQDGYTIRYEEYGWVGVYARLCPW